MAIRERVLAVVQTFNAPRFATLTLAHREESLDSMRRRLADSFREMRKQPEWKERVKSGVWVIETTLNQKTGKWHLHLHLIIDGQFFPQALMSKVWHRVTGDSMICDIRAVPDRKKAVAYIADYVAKPVELANWESEKIREFAIAMHGVRMVHTFGKAHKATVESEEPASESKASEFVIHTVVLKRLAREGNAKAQFAVQTLRHWRQSVCEALGFDWVRTENGLGATQSEDVKTALRVCAELERGLLVDPPPKPPESHAAMETTMLFTGYLS
jgi:Replication protein